ncbi:hypothetical protein Tco_1105721 [Tanacetum coccineum]
MNPLRWIEAANHLSSKTEIRQVDSKNLLDRFPAQSVGSSNTDVLDSPCLLVLITGTSQSRQHDLARHLQELVYVGSRQDFHLHCEYLSITQMFWQDLKDNARIQYARISSSLESNILILRVVRQDTLNLSSDKDLTDCYGMAMAALSTYTEIKTHLAFAETLKCSCFLDDQLTNFSPPRKLYANRCALRGIENSRMI